MPTMSENSNTSGTHCKCVKRCKGSLAWALAARVFNDTTMLFVLGNPRQGESMLDCACAWTVGLRPK